MKSHLLVSCLFLIFLCSFGPEYAYADQQSYATFNKGISLEKSLQIFSAKDFFNAAIAQDPSNSGYLEHYAWFLHYHGFNEEAVAVFSQVLTLKPENTDLLRGKAWNLKVIGKLTGSLDLYRRLYPFSSPTGKLQAETLELNRMLSEANEIAIAKLKQHLVAKPSDNEAVKELFRNLAYQGRFVEAYPIGERLLKVLPADLLFHLDFARALVWGNRVQQAIAVYDDLLVQSPDNPFLLLELGNAQAQAARLDDAYKMLRHANMLKPEEIRIRRALAEIEARRGDVAEAVKLADASVTNHKKTLEQILTLARARHFGGLLNEAIPFYQEGLQSYPQQPDLLWGLAECATYTGQYDKARTALAEFARVAPDDARRTALEGKVWRNTAPKIDLNAQYYANSSHFSRINSGAEFEMRVGNQATIGAETAFTRFHQDNYRAQLREFLAIKGNYSLLPALDLGAEVGGNIYDRGDSHVIAAASLKVRPQLDWYVAASWNRIDVIDTEPMFGNAIYNHVVTIGSVGSRIYSDEYSIYLQWDLLSRRLSLSGKYIFGDYSDHNQKQSRYAGISYRLFDTPQVTAGYQYFFLDYLHPASVYREGANSTSAYYDPINFEVHTGFLNLSHEVAPGLHLGAELRLSHIPKSDGIGYSTFGSASFDLTKHSTIKLDARFFYQTRGIERTGTSGLFRASDVLLGYSYRF